jgi:hypothetical protein
MRSHAVRLGTLAASVTLASSFTLACGSPSGESLAQSGAAVSTGTIYNFGALAHPGSCLDASGAGTSDGTQIQEWQCNGGGAQAYAVEDAGNGAVKLVNTNANKCVDVNAQGTANGTKVQLWDCNGSGAQSYVLRDAGNGFVNIVNTHSNKCLDVQADNPANGTLVQLYDCNGTSAQLWNPAAIGVVSGGGGSTGSGGGSSGSGGGSTGAACKRGIASNAAPSSAIGAGVSWWYDWATEPTSGAAAGIEFVPMVWGRPSLNGPIAGGSKYVLGFNEPNFAGQSDMTPTQAAQSWPQVEALAHAQGIPIVAPGVNFCGSASDPSGCSDPSVTDPYTYLHDFFNACPGCEVDYIAVHWYNCDLPSLQAYIDGNASLAGFVQFGKPIWLTEFACDGSHSVADQDAYMRAAIPYLEGNSHVFRYSWFSASPIPNALLMNSNGSLTSLGQTYVDLPQDCK